MQTTEYVEPVVVSFRFNVEMLSRAVSDLSAGQLGTAFIEAFAVQLAGLTGELTEEFTTQRPEFNKGLVHVTVNGKELAAAVSAAYKLDKVRTGFYAKVSGQNTLVYYQPVFGVDTKQQPTPLAGTL